MQLPEDIWQLKAGMHIDDAMAFTAAARTVAEALSPREIDTLIALEQREDPHGRVLEGVAVAFDEATERVKHHLYCEFRIERFYPDPLDGTPRTLPYMQTSRLVVAQHAGDGRERLVLDLTERAGEPTTTGLSRLLNFPTEWWWEVGWRLQLLCCMGALSPDLVHPLPPK